MIACVYICMHAVQPYLSCPLMSALAKRYRTATSIHASATTGRWGRPHRRHLLWLLLFERIRRRLQWADFTLRCRRRCRLPSFRLGLRWQERIAAMQHSVAELLLPQTLVPRGSSVWTSRSSDKRGHAIEATRSEGDMKYKGARRHITTLGSFFVYLSLDLSKC